MSNQNFNFYFFKIVIEKVVKIWPFSISDDLSHLEVLLNSFFSTFVATFFKILSLIFIIIMFNIYVVNNYLHFFKWKLIFGLREILMWSLVFLVRHSLHFIVISNFLIWFNRYLFTKKLLGRTNKFMRTYLFMITVTVQLGKSKKNCVFRQIWTFLPNL